MKKMRMNKKLTNYFQQKGPGYYHYYHLKRDKEFLAEAAKLKPKLYIKTDNQSEYFPSASSDYDMLDDPEAEKKKALIQDFMKRWNIHWDHYLLTYMLIGDKNNIPPPTKGNVGVSFNKDRNMFVIQAPLSVRHEDMEIMWGMINYYRNEMGIRLSKRGSSNIYTPKNTEIAYTMGKLERDKVSWTKILKKIEEQYGRSFDGITTAKRFLNTYGFRW